MPHVFRRRKLLLIFLIASLVFSLAKVSVPAPASPPQTRVYVKMPAEGYINGTEIGVGNYFTVDVYIENAVNLVQWALSVQVDPAVLEVCGATDGPGTVIYDYVEGIPIWFDLQTFLVGPVNKTEGKIIDILHAIIAWPDLYPMGYTGFNGSGKLCTLGFKVKSETEYSPIHLYDVLLFDSLYWETKTPHYFPPDIVEDGHYNPPPPPGGDAAVINVVPSFSEAYTTWTIQVNVTVLNNGTQTMSCTVAVYYNASTWYEIGTQPVTDLAEGANTTLTFNWNLSGVAYGVYTIKANATLAGDTYPDNNEKVDGQVKVRLRGDMDDDGYVGPFDLGMFTAAYGKSYPNPLYKERADLDPPDAPDGYIGPVDLGCFGAQFGESV